MKHLFISGTDTGVGKTVVTAALLTEARRAGWDAVPMKPVQTGCSGPALRAPDLDFCLTMSNLKCDEPDRLSPVRYRPACSPHLAAALTGVPVRLAPILAAWKRLCARHDVVLAEGAGGLMVPLSRRILMLDLARRFGAPILLVAKNRLGALNHTLLSLEVLRSRKLPVAGFVLVDSPGDQIVLDDNERTLCDLAPATFLGRLPVLACLKSGRPSPEAFAKATRRFARKVWDGLQ